MVGLLTALVAIVNLRSKKDRYIDPTRLREHSLHNNYDGPDCKGRPRTKTVEKYLDALW